MLMLLAIRQIPASAAASKPSSTVASLGKAMFTDYLWTVELAGALLLIATVAAILIAQDDDHDSEEAYDADSDTHPIARS
jgi:NADH:ubiquinone oxidoreductase subunit 6 (subunit J)